MVVGKLEWRETAQCQKEFYGFKGYGVWRCSRAHPLGLAH